MSERRSRDSRFREGALWCDSHRVRPPRCQDCGRTFVRLSMDRDEIARTDPATGPVCTRCEGQARRLSYGNEPEGSADMARGVGPGDVNWQEAGVYGDQPLVEQAAELAAGGMGPTAIAEELNMRHGLELAAHRVGQVVRKARRAGLPRPPAAPATTPSVPEGVNGDGGKAGGAQNPAPQTAPMPDPELVDALNELREDPDAHEEFAREIDQRLRRYDRGASGGDGGGDCRIDVNLPGLELRVTGASVEQLLERVAGAERLIGGMLP